jgi:hypothetical protein
MPTELTGGTQTAVVGTDHTLVTDTTNKTYVLFVDTVNMAKGDIVEITIFTKGRTGNASQRAYLASFQNAQSSPNKYSQPIPANVEIVCKLKQTAGTARNFIWALLSL